MLCIPASLPLKLSLTLVYHYDRYRFLQVVFLFPLSLDFVAVDTIVFFLFGYSLFSILHIPLMVSGLSALFRYYLLPAIGLCEYLFIGKICQCHSLIFLVGIPEVESRFMVDTDGAYCLCHLIAGVIAITNHVSPVAIRARLHSHNKSTPYPSRARRTQLKNTEYNTLNIYITGKTIENCLSSRQTALSMCHS